MKTPSSVIAENKKWIEDITISEQNIANGKEIKRKLDVIHTLTPFASYYDEMLSALKEAHDCLDENTSGVNAVRQTIGDLISRMEDERTVVREEITQPEYRQILDKENHHTHAIIKEGDVIRWKKNDHVDKMMDKLDLNKVIVMLYSYDLGKNSETFRRLYRDLGCSLSGYFDVFYWEVNNEKCEDYSPPQKLTNRDFFDFSDYRNCRLEFIYEALKKWNNAK